MLDEVVVCVLNDDESKNDNDRRLPSCKYTVTPIVHLLQSHASGYFGPRAECLHRAYPALSVIGQKLAVGHSAGRVTTPPTPGDGRPWVLTTHNASPWSAFMQHGWVSDMVRSVTFMNTPGGEIAAKQCSPH